MKATAESKNSKKTILRIVLIALFVLLALYCAVMLIKNTADISRLKAQKEELDSQYSQQVEENERLEGIVNSDDKDEYIEQEAREKGYVKECETVFYNIDDIK